MENEIKILPLSSIKPYWRNPRKINVDAVELVSESIRKYGFNQPIVIDKNNTIVVGHTRYKALQKLGIEKCACVILDLDPKKIREYRLVDNKTNSLTTWDWEDLKLELRELELSDIQDFFPDINMEDLLDKEMGSIEKCSPPEQEKITKLQEELNNHFEEKSKEITDKYVDLICPECGSEFSIKKDDIVVKEN